MTNCITLTDYTIIDGIFKGTIVIDGLNDELSAECYLKNSRSDIKCDVSLNKCDGENDNKKYIIETGLSDSKLQTGTWYPVISIAENEYYFSYNNLTNSRDVGSMLNLTEEGFYFDAETKIHYMGALDKDSLFVIRKWRERNPGISRGFVTVTDFSLNGSMAEFVLKSPYEQDIVQAEVWLWSRVLKRVKRMPVCDIDRKRKSFCVNFDEYISFMLQHDTGRLWELYLVVNNNGSFCHNRIEIRGKGYFERRNIRKSVADESERYLFNVPDYNENGDYDRLGQIYFSKQGRLCGKVTERRVIYKEMFRGELSDMKFSSEYMAVSMDKIVPGFENARIIVRYTDSITGRVNTVEWKKQSGNNSDWFLLNYDDVEWVNLRYDILLLADKDDYTYEFRLICGSRKFMKKLANIYANSHSMKDDRFIYIAESIGEKLVIECRHKTEYDSMFCRIKEKIALYLAPMIVKWQKDKKLLLFYEKFGTAAQDNSFYMFEYFKQADCDDSVVLHYVLEKKAADYKQLKKKYGKSIVPFMSIRHLIDLQVAKMYISTDSKRHCYRWRSGSTKMLRRINDRFFVFLQHGVLGLKRVEDIYSSQYINKANIFIVSSEYEKELVERVFGYEKNEIAVTGLARWDMLENRECEKRNVFYMPTWRNWILEVDIEEFVKTEYYKSYMEILNSERLAELLEKYDVHLTFCLHPKFRKFSGEINSRFERIKILDFADCKINELLMECNMFITDYSSASWDVFYMEKPVLFYQFDGDRYMKEQGSYINFEKDLFGYRAVDFEGFLEKFEYIVANEFCDKPEDAIIRDRHLPYRDNNNRKRIYDVVMEKLL